MLSLRLLRRQTTRLVPVLVIALYATLHQPLFASMNQPATANDAAEATEKKTLTIYGKLAKLYLPAMEEQRLQEEREAAAFQKKTDEQMQKFWEFTSIQLPQLLPVTKLQVLYDLLDTYQADHYSASAEILNDNVFSDLEMLCGYTGKADSHVFKAIDQTVTSVGAIQLQRLLAEPLVDKEKLESRQAIIKALVTNEPLFEALDKQLQRIKATESEFLWLYKPLQGSITQLTQIGQTPELFGINKSASASEFIKWAGLTRDISLPLLATGLSCFFFWQNDIPTSVLTGVYAGLIGYLLGTVEITANNIRKTMHSKMNGAATFSSACRIMGATINKNTDFRELFPVHNTLRNVVETKTEESKELLSLLATDTFKSDPSFFARQGRVIAAFNLMREIQDSFIGTLMTVGQLDAYLSIAKLYKKYANHPRVKFCFVQYEKADKPHLALTKFWHPALNPDIVVANDLELGATNNARDSIITGPNAGGKSTSLKAITLCVLLAQCMGIAPAAAMTITPFTKINTYMNIADSTGTASLFQAEMRRTSKLLALIKDLRPTEFAFVIMDEIFTGTNYKEGQAGAYGVTKKLSGYDNTIALFATHYKVLTELEQVTKGVVKNYKVSVIRNPDGSFIFPYRLEAGITDQAIALELLQQEGFDSDILDAAHEIMDRNKPEKAGVTAGA